MSIGFPTLFITITCNPQWPEIQRVLKDTNLRPGDRPNILCCVFKMNLDNVWTIEFQKRGLPHTHILLWLHNDDKPKTPKEIDKIICVEIPDEETDKKMYQLVEKYMIHGPCGQANLKYPCMKDRVCTKRFPKPFVQRTESDTYGYTVYRRREDGITVMKKKTTLDNGFVVPYNWVLLSKYRSHINIELCNQNMSIKYMLKYVNKGHNRVTAAFYERRNIDGCAEIRDEIKMYYDCRYLSACEAMWRLFNLDIHYRDPSIIRLSFYLPDHQSLVFNENKSLQSVLGRQSAKQTMFLAWFEVNKSYPHARDLRYGDFPQKFVYKEDSCTWAPRKNGFSIGRIANVPPAKGEDYYLRLLLNIQRGAEYMDEIREVNAWASGDYIRRLFAVMLLSNSLSRPEHVWQSCCSGLAEGIAYREQWLHNNPKKILQSNGKSLRNYVPMPFPIEFAVEDTINILVLDELDYDGLKWVKNFNATVRSKGEIVINVASSGISSLLLIGGRTTHFRFRLPITVHETSTYNITQQSPQVDLMIRAKLIMWNEAPMMHMNCFEALDKTMKSILQVDKPFGGKVVVLGGYFRQILPIVLNASRQDIVHATVNSSPLWHFCRVMKLSKNMRLQSCSSPSNVDEVIEFGYWILKVGNGNVREQYDGEASLEIPEDMLIGDSEDLFRDLLNFVYPDLLSNMYDPDYFQGRAILAPTNERVESVNDHLMSLLPGEEKVYLSSDRLCNGTRLQIIIIDIHVLHCKLLFGKNIGDIVFIPQMTLIPSNFGLSIKFKRRQFSLIVSFAMTIKKSQCQTLSHVGLYIPRPIFSYDQLYIALSRVKSRGGIKIVIKWDSDELTDVTRNAVYKEVFHRI
ncbi:hypothetical protein ACP275_10G120900 [Erythranthe tilingii]